MSCPRIIIISGKQGSGKSTLSMNLKAKLGHVEQMRFAQVIYDMHTACLPILKHYGIRPDDMQKDGELLQVLGTDYGRKYLGDDVWVKALRRRVELYLASFPLGIVVIDDCRFENEIEAFPDALKVRLECIEQLRQGRCSYWRSNTDHPSEVGLDEYEKFDITINTGRLYAGEVLSLVIDAWEKKNV
jgi:hypothetical protein